MNRVLSIAYTYTKLCKPACIHNVGDI